MLVIVFKCGYLLAIAITTVVATIDIIEEVKTEDSILKSRDITLSTNIRLVKAMVFPVVMYGCESWTIKKVECRRIDAFELWCWRRLLRVPWATRKPVNPKGDSKGIHIGRTDAKAETPILWPPDAKSRLIGKDPDSGKD